MAAGSAAEYFTYSVLAGASQTANQYKFVKPASTAGEIIVGTSATSACLGVLMNDPADGEVAEVAVIGTVRVLAEASVSAGDLVACSTTGRAKTSTTSNNKIMGKALEASSSAGDLITIALAPSNY